MTFAHLAIYFRNLEQTSSRNAMTEQLAELFKKASADEIGKICYLLQGRVAPLYEAVEFGVGDKLMIRAIAKAYKGTDDEVKRAFKKLGDLGIVAETCYHVSKHGNRKQQNVVEVFECLDGLTRMSGEGSQEKKIEALAGLFCSVDAISARYLARIPLDKLRLGFSDMTILDALSWMLAGDKSLRMRLEDVYNIRPDIGLLAEQVKAHGMEGLSYIKATVGVPILASLCQRLPTADEMIKKMGTVGVEPKYDGVRVQIHYKSTNGKWQMANVKTFSRNLENTTAMFPELQDVGKQLHAQEIILDSEAVGLDPKTGKIIPFQETMTRKRKHKIGAARLSVPLKFFVFDILYKNGKELLSVPLNQRRTILEATVGKGDILVVSPQIVTDKPEDVRSYHDEQLKKGLEGVVVKRWDSPYEPGRRGYSWVKFKQEEGKTGKLTDTIDAVVMGYYRGEGKRSGFGIGAFLVGVKKGETFVTITKIGTGVTDVQWRELRRQLNRLKVSKQPKEYASVNNMFTPDVWVIPKVVVELAGDDLTNSPTHGAGIAVRFPRLVTIRRDKSPQQATTVSELTSMYASQGSMKHQPS